MRYSLQRDLEHYFCTLITNYFRNEICKENF